MRIHADTPRIRPCEDTGKVVTYSRGERPQRGLTATPWPLTGGLQNWEKSFCCWSYPVCDTLLCRPSRGGPRCPLKNGKRWKCLLESGSDAWFSLSDTLVASPHVPLFGFSCLASLIITYMTGCLGFCSVQWMWQYVAPQGPLCPHWCKLMGSMATFLYASVYNQSLTV